MLCVRLTIPTIPKQHILDAFEAMILYDDQASLDLCVALGNIFFAKKIQYFP